LDFGFALFAIAKGFYFCFDTIAFNKVPSFTHLDVFKLTKLYGVAH
jgi:hypothetical protein